MTHLRWIGLAVLLGLTLACASTKGGGAAPTTSVEPTTASDVAEALPTEEETAVAKIEPMEPIFDDPFEVPEEELPVEELPIEATVDSEALLQESLEAYESAQVFWEQGNFEDSFAALDRAYELMTAVPPNGDELLAQEKENLRHLISRRVIEIYASRQTTVGDLERSIPLDINDYVKREISSFQNDEREFFLDSYRRSGLYRSLIVEELRQAGMPEQISWLPLVESGFKVRAYSRSRALGLWQFISSTGYRYGLERTWWVDERMDPHKSTLGAIGYLTDLHNLFGDWLTALAAYNCGERTVLKRINSSRVSYFDRFWDLYERLPRETRRYVPRFLAVLAILENPAAYGFELPEPLPAQSYEMVKVERPAQLKTLNTAMDLGAGTLEALNPELRRKATPDEPYELKVPAGQSQVLLASLEKMPEWVPPKDTYTIHRVRRGETLSGIASRYRTSVRAIMDLNSLRSAHRIWPGQQLRVPDRRPPSTRVAQVPIPGGELTYSVRRGDSLWRIARRYGTTVDRIKRDNGLKSTTLQPGQKLLIRASSSGPGSTYVVRRGDTLGKIAERERVSLNRLLQANGLSRRSTIYPGQRLWIPN